MVYLHIVNISEYNMIHVGQQSSHHNKSIQEHIIKLYMYKVLIILMHAIYCECYSFLSQVIFIAIDGIYLAGNMYIIHAPTMLTDLLHSLQYGRTPLHFAALANQTNCPMNIVDKVSWSTA